MWLHVYNVYNVNVLVVVYLVVLCFTDCPCHVAPRFVQFCTKCVVLLPAYTVLLSSLIFYGGSSRYCRHTFPIFLPHLNKLLPM